MHETAHIRFVATNFSNLQGLRAVPLGALLLLVCLWANNLQGPASDLTLPLTYLILAALLLIAIDRYYLHVFGRVQRTLESRRLEWLLSVVAGMLALGGFILDTTGELPVSLLGLVSAFGLLVDYIRVTWLVRGRFLLYYPIGAVVMAVLSLLNLVIPDWWQTFGLRDQLLAIAIVFGIYVILSGIWGHLFLIRTLPSRLEINDEQSI